MKDKASSIARIMMRADGSSRRTVTVHILRLLLLFVAIAIAGANGGCDDDSFEWKLVWQDEFNGSVGHLPDPGKWRFNVGGTGWGNAQLEFDTDRPENVSLTGDGYLAITARKEFYGGMEYTSGRINTSGLFHQRNGRFEARIQLPLGQGIWPAFWLLGSDFNIVSWPNCGEIDIMEYRGQEPNIVHASIHGPGYSGGSAITGSYRLAGEGFNAGFHLFAIEWEQDRIIWTIDDKRIQAVSKASLPPGTRWVFDHPFYIILNVAVGGYFVGSPDSTTSFPQAMLVDYVRVYRRES